MTTRRSSNRDSDIERVHRSREECRSSYNRLSRVYDLLADRAEAPLRHKGLEMLAAEPGETVLEIGPGTGHSLADLATAVGDDGLVLGVDLSEGMANHSRRRLDRMGLTHSTVVACGDALQLPLPDSCIGALFSSFSVELFDTPDIPRLLAECYRVLQPQGRVVVVSLAKVDDDLAVRTYEWTHRHFPNLLDCRPIRVAEALRAAGFLVRQHLLERMWVPVDLVLATKSS